MILLSLAADSLSNHPHSMKNFVIILLLGVSVVLGAFVAHLQKQRDQFRTELTKVQGQLVLVQEELRAGADAANQIADAKRSSKVLQETLTEASKRAEEKARQAEELQLKLAAKTNSSNPMAGMAKMFNDPKMKEMIKTQQKAVLGPMLDKQYGELFKKLNLTTEEGAQLKTLLLDKMLAGADVGMAMMDDSLDAAKRKELSAQVKTQSDDYDAQIKEFLGDAYPSYQTYEKTVSDRMTVSQFSDQLSGENTMNPDQQAQLIQAMNDARTSFKWSTDYSNKNPADGDFAAMFSEDRLNKFTEEKELFDQQFLEQAQKILTPEQAKQFAQFQDSQRQMQIMGMKMAAQMFAPKSQ